MALAKQREAWARTGVQVASVVNACGNPEKPLRPCDVIPRVFRYPEPPPVPKTPEQLESESRRAWKLLDRFMMERRGRKKTFRLKEK